jgi:hypothetical protein
MSPGPYELSDLKWERIKDFLPGCKEHVGRTAADNRLIVNGMLRVIALGIARVRFAEALRQVQERA